MSFADWSAGGPPAASGPGSGPVNPFALISHRRDALYRAAWALNYALLPIVYPIRVLGFLLALLFLELFARLSVIGLDLSQPVPRWRREVSRAVTTFWAAMLCAFAGYSIEEHSMEFKPDLDRAHIVVANHVTAMDGLLYAALGFPAFIAKEEVRAMPVFGTTVWVNQGLFVKRENKASRRRCLHAIKQRALENYWFDMVAGKGGARRFGGGERGAADKQASNPSDDARGNQGGNPVVREARGDSVSSAILDLDPAVDLREVSPVLHRSRRSRPWPCLFMFPESTTTNSTALIHFKKGAFTPGLPVCPVITRYDQRFVDVSDTYQSMAKALLKTMMCLRTKVVVKYLPEYTPSPAERADCELYAANVRDLMARALGVPATDYTYEDKRYYTGKEDDYSRCSPGFQEAFGRGCCGRCDWQPARWDL